VFVHNDKEYSLSGTEASEDVAHMKRLFPEAKFSNPTMEMLALVKALENFTGRGEHIIINQDYKGAVNYNGLWDKSEGSAQRDPKPWKSKEAYITYLVNRAETAIDTIEQSGGSVKLTWVKGHSGNIMNEKADQAAKAREEFDTFEDVYKENDNDNTPCQGGAPF
jgi:ribonuclease HI